MRSTLSLLCLLLLPLTTVLAAEEEVLPPEQAFRFTVHLADAQTVEVRYDIAAGYYLYRDKFHFASDTEGVTLGSFTLPPGKLKHDEFFGKVQTYRGHLSVRVPFRGGADADAFQLKSQFQGCADAGICYTPQTRVSTIKLAMAQSATRPLQGAAADEGLGNAGALSKLNRMVAANESTRQDVPSDAEAEEEFLPVEQAFKIKVIARDGRTLEAEFSPEPSYYLYRDKIGLDIAPGSGIALEKLTLPRGKLKSDPNFGDTEVFHHAFKGIALLKRAAGGSQAIAVDVRFQGCSEKGLCYPPTTRRVQLVLPAAPATQSDIAPGAGPADGPPSASAIAPDPGSVANRASTASPLPAATAEEVDETSQVARMLREASFWGVVASFLGFGLLLALTPCVFPMIPILSGIIVGQGKTMTRGRGLSLSAIYVLGMAITYAMAGVAAGLSGALLTSALQNPWVLSAFALIFVALALSMFGFYDLQMPAALQSRLNDASNRQRGGTAGGVFIMGVLSALIVGPCVAAPLAGALVYISQTRDVVLGGTALFAMALGMGAPLLLVGWSAGSLLPRAGAWMQTVKSFFGVLLLAVALWLISPVIPAVAQMLGWAALLICSAVYLHAVDPLPQHSSGMRKLWKGVGVIALLLGVAMLIGALSGARDPLQPLSGLRAAGAAAPEHGPSFERVATIAALEQRIAAAGGRPVMLDFYADWCVSCKEMERFTFSDPTVKASMASFVLLQADVTRNTADDSALLKRFGLFGPPGIIFFDRSGRELPTRVVGFQPPERFAKALRSIEN